MCRSLFDDAASTVDLQGPVMDQQQLVVGAQLDVDLDHVGTLLDSHEDAGERILGRLGGGAAMGDDPGRLRQSERSR